MSNSTTPRNILLTGGTGFLGSHLLKRLLEMDFSVILLRRTTSDLRRIRDFESRIIGYNIDQVPLDQVFQKHPIDTVINCATEYGRNYDPAKLIQANLNFPLGLLHLAKKHGVRAFLSTDTVLGKLVNPYSLSKKQFREWLKFYSDDLTCINIALDHIYGPNDDQTKFISWIIGKLIGDSEKIELTRGEQERNFIYIDDVVAGLTSILTHSIELEKGFFEFEIGAEDSIQIHKIVTMIKSISENKKTELVFGAIPYRENEMMLSSVNLKPIFQLGWRPQTGLQEGLMKTIEFERERKSK